MSPLQFRKVVPGNPGDAPLLEEIFRLRYDVYTQECGFIDPAEFPNGLESDTYDPHAVHFVALSRGKVIATTRLLLGRHHLLPVEKHCPQLYQRDPALRHRSAEISRLIICRHRCKGREKRLFRKVLLKKKPSKRVEQHFSMHVVAFGLFEAISKESKKLGITNLFTLMEKGLWRLLRKYGLLFSCVGDEVNVFGPVHPYLGKLSVLEQTIASYKVSGAGDMFHPFGVSVSFS